MELQRTKENNDSSKQVFERRLDEILARGKHRPLRPPPPIPTMASPAEPRQLLPAASDMTSNENRWNNAEIDSSQKYIKYKDSRKLLIKEMIERNQASRRVSCPGPPPTPPPRRFPRVVQTIITKQPPPPPPTTISSASVESVLSSEPIPMSSSIPMSSTTPLQPFQQMSSSMPNLTPPTSPNLINFPSSDESDGESDSAIERNSCPEQTSGTQPNFLMDFVEGLIDTTEIGMGTNERSGSLDILQDLESLFVSEPQDFVTNSTSSSESSQSESSDAGISSLNLASSSSFVSQEDFGNPSLLNDIVSRWTSAGPSELSLLSRASSSSSSLSAISFDATPGGLKISDKIVWFTENGVPETGEVKWVGKIKDRFNAGIHFEKPVGNSSGTLQGKKFFTSPMTHGRFVPVSELMFYDDFYQGTASNNAPSRFPHGIPDLNDSSDLESMPFVCVICQDALLTKDEESKDKNGTKEMLSTKCGHLFHSKCLRTWFKLKTKVEQPCPYCQRMMNTADTIRIFPVQGKQ